MLTFSQPWRHIVTNRKIQTRKKNLRAKTIFLQKSCAQKNENKASPFFAEFLGRKIQSAIFGGSDLEKKPLEYINRRFYNFQFINRTKLNLEPTQISFYKRDHRPTNDNNNYKWRKRRHCACGGSDADGDDDDYRPNNRVIPVSLRRDDVWAIYETSCIEARRSLYAHADRR